MTTTEATGRKFHVCKGAAAQVIPVGGTGVILRDDAAPVASPPDIAAQYLDIPGLSLRAASLRGPGHRAWGEPRQDSYAVVETEEWLVAVVADGIGSKKWSHVGSSVASQAIAAAVAEGANPEEPQDLLAAADEACVRAARTLGVQPADLYTTVTIVAVPKSTDESGARGVTIHEVGDSPALLLGGTDGTWTILTPEEKLGSNPVDAVVPGLHDLALTYGVRVSEGDAIVIASDGLLEHFGDGANGYADALAHAWRGAPRPLIQFIADLSTNFDSDCREDDRTVIAIWKTSEDSGQDSEATVDDASLAEQ